MNHVHRGCVALLLSALSVLLPAAAAAPDAERFPLVITGGRVMDPESGYDAIANVAIADGRIARISTQRLRGDRTIDARGLVVAPGFIDLHSHGQVLFAQDRRAADGVTTALEMEIGVFPVAPFLAALEGKARINFGATVSHQGLRIKTLTGQAPGHPMSRSAAMAALLADKATWAEAPMSPEQVRSALADFRTEVAAGGLGLGLAIEYVPGTDRREAYWFMREAARLGVPVYTHVRATTNSAPGSSLEVMQEVIANAAVSGGALHICHVTSKGRDDTEVIIGVVEEARKQGLDITTEAYPYTAGSTAIGSALFNEGWQERWGKTYADIEWPLTGERLDAESFARFRKEAPAQSVIFHMIPEQAMDFAIAHPMVMIASDGGAFVGNAGHPRASGTNARVLGLYVRERGVLNLMDALRKMTILPARRLEAAAPMMKRKGRLQEGMDADVTVFDPRTVIDRATYRQPNTPSAGIEYVLVGGVAIIERGVLQKDRHPGQAIRSQLVAAQSLP